MPSVQCYLLKTEGTLPSTRESKVTILATFINQKIGMNFKKPALDFSNKGLTKFPDEIFEISRLYKLNLSNNKIKEIPRELGQLKYLETLNLNGNEIRHLYAKNFDLPNVKTLILNNNRIINISKQISNLKSLKILGLANNNISVLPNEIGELPILEELNVAGNHLNFLPDSIFMFYNLKSLWIGNNPLKDVRSANLVLYFTKLKRVYCNFTDDKKVLLSEDQGIIRASKQKGNCLKILNDALEKQYAEEQNVKVDEQKKDENKKEEIVGTAKIFISYAHADDKKYIERLRTHLKVLKRNVDFDFWDDSKISSSDDWKAEIMRALNEATAAILLVSTDFLASDFIHDSELPPLIKAAKERGTRLYSVILEPCMYEDNKAISQFQAVNDPKKALGECTSQEQDRIWIKLCEDLKMHMTK